VVQCMDLFSTAAGGGLRLLARNLAQEPLQHVMAKGTGGRPPTSGTRVRTSLCRQGQPRPSATGSAPPTLATGRPVRSSAGAGWPPGIARGTARTRLGSAGPPGSAVTSPLPPSPGRSRGRPPSSARRPGAGAWGSSWLRIGRS
jgi:hypothetical protein